MIDKNIESENHKGLYADTILPDLNLKQPTIKRLQYKTFNNLFAAIVSIYIYQRNTSQISFPVFKECVSHSICLTVNKPYSFQAFVFKESVDERCILECYSGKCAVFKNAILQITFENYIRNLSFNKRCSAPHNIRNSIFP